MEIFVSLAHEIRVDRQDKPEKSQPLDGQQRALEQQDQQRIKEEYGIDTPKEEIEQKEKERIEREQEQREENSAKPPADLGQRKPDAELTGSEIQDQYDNLTKI